MTTNDPVTALTAAARAWRRSDHTATARREELDDAVVNALAAGVAQRVIAEVTGFSRETIRATARRRGLPPSR